MKSRIKKISAHFFIHPTGGLMKYPLLQYSEGKLLSIDTQEKIQESALQKFYNGLILPPIDLTKLSDTLPDLNHTLKIEQADFSYHLLESILKSKDTVHFVSQFSENTLINLPTRTNYLIHIDQFNPIRLQPDEKANVKIISLID